MSLPTATARRAGAGDRSSRGRQAVLVAATLAVAAGLVSVAAGAAGLSLGEVVHILWAGATGQRHTLPVGAATIILDIRLPRVLLALLVGASLALSGAAMQGLFRNPLADPGIVGVSSGAALAAVIVIVLGPTLMPFMPAAISRHLLPLAAFFGGLGTTALLYRLATREGQTSIATMLLVGIALAALGGAITGILIFISDDQQLRELTFWTMGGFGGATWLKLAAALPLIVPAFIAAPFMARGLNALALGEAEAFHLGIEVERLKGLAILVIAAAVGAAVAVSGIIGFVGLVAPHLLRVAIGPDHRTLLPAAAFLGAALLAIADLIARTSVAPAEMPIGILTALIGAPFFLWLLLRRRGALVL
ncbi:FecCD family ABC transporter permease [Mangrovicella endophytica]|uniref:FecCD family ABC transporter permease n=1 Tax=Mangrovicella endophytica TaxID=2066697 RepID=UPI000C9E4DA1|nr:iron ABC transporter permease [Mangrovicella endophytica]